MTRLFVSNLSVIDFSYLDRKRGIVGESWIVDIELFGNLDHQGMVYDFGTIKQQIKQFIDDEIDHRLLVPITSSGCKTTVHNDELFIEFPLVMGGMLTHQSPCPAVLLVDANIIEAKNIVTNLQTKIKTILPDNVIDIQINLRHEAINGAYYHYTHGLQKHLGQCQRIAHGHRSRIEIQVDGKRNKEIETEWANQLKDSYIATQCHITEEFQLNGIAHTRLAYQAQQGNFAISLPSAQVFTIPMESTVENLAHYFAAIISTKNKGDILVKAFEGVNKGAFGEASMDQEKE